jgi:membrane-associated phospholipid phosphatase
MDAVVGRLTTFDQGLVDRVARVESELLDHALPRLGAAADYGRLWICIAAVLALTGRDGRRAAVRGLVSLGVASATANILAKGVFRRGRPTLHHVPPHRWLGRAPVTTSFPSGHSASAAAFATGASLEMPGLAVPLGPLAVGVVVSRVVTGVHYPSDVAAGSALGVGAALLTLRWWPRGSVPWRRASRHPAKWHRAKLRKLGRRSRRLVG